MEPVDDTLSPLARNVLSAQVKDRLLRSIIEGELPPGSRIIETRIARQLGTSQAPVREALRDLATLGLVEMQAFRGARVRAPHADELIEAMEVRGELEAIAARAAAVKVTDDDLRAMRALIARMYDCAEAGDAHAQAMANSEFHTLVDGSAPVGDTRTVRADISDRDRARRRSALAGRASRRDRRGARVARPRTRRAADAHPRSRGGGTGPRGKVRRKC